MTSRLESLISPLLEELRAIRTLLEGKPAQADLFAPPKPAPKPKPVKVTMERALEMAPDFGELYQQHPRRESGVDAFKAYQQTESIQPAHAELMRIHKAHCRLWSTREPDKIPLLATWLRGQKWNDQAPGLLRPVPAPATPAVPVDLATLKRQLQGDVGGHLRRHGVTQPQLGEILSELDDLNEEPALREWAEGAKRRWTST